MTSFRAGNVWQGLLTSQTKTARRPASNEANRDRPNLPHSQACDCLGLHFPNRFAHARELFLKGRIVQTGGSMGNQIGRNNLGLGESEFLMGGTEVHRIIVADRLYQQSGGIADRFGANAFLDLLETHASVCNGGQVIIALWSQGKASLSLCTPPWGCTIRMFDSISARRSLAARFLFRIIRFFGAAVTIVTDARESTAEDEATRPPTTCNAVSTTVHPHH